MIPKEDRYKFAKQRFLEANPSLQETLNNLSETTASHVGITLDEYRDTELDRAFAAHAENLGHDLALLVIDICASDESEQSIMLLERAKEIAGHLGMEWDEYKKLNSLEALDANYGHLVTE